MSDVRLIDANALAEEFIGGECMKSVAEAIADKRFVKAIRQAPTIDAVPVVHAYWMDDTYCSNCRAAKARLWAGYLDQNANTFCHVCGAKMDAKED